MKILIATSNLKKADEIISILKADEKIPWEFLSLPKTSEPEEPYPSFIENACHKARFYGQLLGLPTLSEDTGLCISALKQFPGVNTKEFVMKNGTIEQAILSLQQEMQHFSDKSAFFNCATALYVPALDLMLSYEAIETGCLTFPPRGNDGFGFDPIFIPAGFKQTLAELGSFIKNRQGHRAMAIKGLIKKMSERLELRRFFWD